MPRQHFITWLRSQVTRDDPVGDLARDVRRDLDWPPAGPRTLRRLTAHLRDKGAVPEAVEALQEAYQEWQGTSEKGSTS